MFAFLVTGAWIELRAWRNRDCKFEVNLIFCFFCARPRRFYYVDGPALAFLRFCWGSVLILPWHLLLEGGTSQCMTACFIRIWNIKKTFPLSIIQLFNKELKHGLSPHNIVSGTTVPYFPWTARFFSFLIWSHFGFLFAQLDELLKFDENSLLFSINPAPSMTNRGDLCNVCKT